MAALLAQWQAQALAVADDRVAGSGAGSSGSGSGGGGSAGGSRCPLSKRFERLGKAFSGSEPTLSIVGTCS